MNNLEMENMLANDNLNILNKEEHDAKELKKESSNESKTSDDTDDTQKQNSIKDGIESINDSESDSKDDIKPHNLSVKHVEELRLQVQHGFKPLVNVIGAMHKEFEIKVSKTNQTQYVTGVFLSCLKSRITVSHWQYQTYPYNVARNTICVLGNVRVRHLGGRPYLLMTDKSFILNKFDNSCLEILINEKKQFKQQNKENIDVKDCM